MPAQNSFSLLTALSDQDVQDIGVAAKKDPALLTPEPLTASQEVSRGLNDVVKFFGGIFNQPDLVQAANQKTAEYKSAEEARLMARLLPVIGEARNARKETEHQEKLAQQKEILTSARANVMSKMQDDYIVDLPGGGTRSPTLQESALAADAYLNFAKDPSSGFNHDLPPGLRPISAQDKADIQQKKQAALEDQRFNDRLKLSEASSMRVDNNRINREHEAKDKEERVNRVKYHEKAAAEFEKDWNSFQGEALKATSAKYDPKKDPAAETKRIKEIKGMMGETVLKSLDSLSVDTSNVGNVRLWTSVYNKLRESVGAELADEKMRTYYSQLLHTTADTYDRNSVPKGWDSFLNRWSPKKK